MSVEPVEYRDAAVNIPPGGRLMLYDVAWEEYERLLVQLGDRPGLRVSFDQGRLEIVSPSAKHEKYKSLLHDMVLILCDQLQQDTSSEKSSLRSHRAFREWIRSANPASKDQ